MSGNKKEFGDYQTPLYFCQMVCEYIKRCGFASKTKTILEPTCGIGNFLSAASNVFTYDRIVGIEINEEYANLSRERVPSATVIVSNIFDVNTRRLCGSDDVLIIGNPPWATIANLTYNLPQKINFKGLRGIDALTGSSNFDICEYIILQLLNEYVNTNSTICMLCKTSVARNVILEMSRNKISYEKVELLKFNSSKVFGISVAACVLVIQLSSQGNFNDEIVCKVKNFDDESLTDTLLVSNGIIKNANTQIDLDGKCQLAWRQGVKHDCGKVMELDHLGDKLVNKNNETVYIEDDLVFPLVKSSQFSMFGIGDYSFVPYKVGLSGFYKKPLFCLLYSDKPVMTDDTTYFLAFENYDIAYSMMLLLNSATVQDFLVSIAFLDNKRPYTVKLLSRLDLKKCIRAVSFDEIQQTENDLLLDKFITKEIYLSLSRFINSQA